MMSTTTKHRRQRLLAASRALPPMHSLCCCQGGASSYPFCTVRNAGIRNWVLLCDGLDECHDHQEAVARGLKQFALGHPHARIIVTTRPVGYSTAEIADWRHYELLPPEPKAGPTHLAAMIQAALPTTNNLHANALDIATGELKKSASAEVISRSPQLLGMAAALLMRGGALRETKAQLYQDLFALVENAPNVRSGNRDISPTTRTRVLNLLGWALITGPLDPVKRVLDRCVDHLEVELGEPRLKALEIASACLEHWEDVGLVEKIYHGSGDLLTFIHKTFSEFTAARYLGDFRDPQAQRSEIVMRTQDEAWSEVLSFAVGIGVGDAVVSALAEVAKGGAVRHLEQALSVLIEPGTKVSPIIQQQIVALAFDYVDSNETDDVYPLGNALADMARCNPSVMNPLAESRSRSTQFSKRLIAWTCGIEGGADFCQLNATALEIRGFVDDVVQETRPSLLPEVVLRGGNGRQLLQRFSLVFIRRILVEWAPDIADQYIAEGFNGGPFNTVGFMMKLEASYNSVGRDSPLSDVFRSASPKWSTRFGQTTEKVKATVKPDREYGLAAGAALRALASSLVPVGGLNDGVDLERSTLVQFSAFLEVVGVGDVPVSDVWAWREPYDPEVLREVLMAVAEISAVDESALGVEATAMLRRMDELPEGNWSRFLFLTISVDVPPPNWSTAKEIRVDRNKLIQALGHKSAWLVQVATKLLVGLGETTIESAADLLANGQGYALAAAVQLTLGLEPAVATQLLLNRIGGPEADGAQYLFRALNELNAAWNEELAAAVQTGLMSLTAEVAEETAVLALKHVEAGESVEPNVLKKAFDHWTAHEGPYPSNGFMIPKSPRKTLLVGLLKLGAVDDAWLMNLCLDTRGDVRDTAAGSLFKRMGQSANTRASFVNEVMANSLLVRLLSRALDAEVPFSESQANQLRILLEKEGRK